MGIWSFINGVQNFGNKFSSGVTDFFKSGLTSDTNSLIDNFSGKTQNEWNQKQYQLQKDTLQYNKELNERLMQREDTEYSRSISDMMSAGLNPAMLYGGSAGTLSSSAGNQLNTASSTQALPAGSLAELAGFVMNMKNVLSQVNKNDAEADNIREDTEGKKLSNIYKQIENTYADIQKKQAIVSEWIKQHGNKYSNSLLEGEVKGRARDGTYQNQPMISESSSWSGLSVSKSSSSTRPYFPNENIPENQLLDRMKNALKNDVDRFSADDREKLASSYLKHIDKGYYPLRKADGTYKLYKMSDWQANEMRKWVKDRYIQYYWQ